MGKLAGIDLMIQTFRPLGGFKLVLPKVLGNTVVASASFNESVVLSRMLAQGAYDAIYVMEAAGAGQTINYMVCGAVVEFLNFVSFPFYGKFFLPMVYKTACEAEGFLSLVHPEDGEELWRYTRKPHFRLRF